MPKAIIITVILAINIAVCDVGAQVPPIERAALVAVFNATNGAGWSNSSGWDTAVLDTECTWYGVTCGGGHVTALRLQSNQLSGSIPAELENLNSLTTLWLWSNQLSGSIPTELGNLSSLQVLYLYSNQLSGGIPAEFGNLSDLTDLELNSNELSGSIPAELGNLSSLVRLKLYSNQLSGSIPPELGNLNSLITLWLYSNQLNGSIPPELGNLSSLVYFRLDSNQLSGSIPVELGNLGNLFSTFSNIGYNALWTDDPTLQAFLYSKDPDWDQTQTIAPAEIAAGSETSSSFVVNWTPILYTGDVGWYQITGPTGIFSDDFETGNTTMWGDDGPKLPGIFTTVDKTDSSILVDGLQPNTEYQFVVRTITDPHATNQNQVASEESAVFLVTTTP